MQRLWRLRRGEKRVKIFIFIKNESEENNNGARVLIAWKNTIFFVFLSCIPICLHDFYNGRCWCKNYQKCQLKWFVHDIRVLIKIESSGIKFNFRVFSLTNANEERQKKRSLLRRNIFTFYPANIFSCLMNSLNDYWWQMYETSTIYILENVWNFFATCWSVCETAGGNYWFLDWWLEALIFWTCNMGWKIRQILNFIYFN